MCTLVVVCAAFGGSQPLPEPCNQLFPQGALQGSHMHVMYFPNNALYKNFYFSEWGGDDERRVMHSPSGFRGIIVASVF